MLLSIVIFEDVVMLRGDYIGLGCFLDLGVVIFIRVKEFRGISL